MAAAAAGRSTFDSLESRLLMSFTQGQDGWSVFGQAAGSEDIHVSFTYGNDTTGNGTIGAPYKSIAKGRSMMTSGTSDHLLLRTGDTWNEPLGNNWFRSGVSDAQPILITSYNDPNHPSSQRPTIATGTADAFTAGQTSFGHLAVVGLKFVADGRVPDGSFSTTSNFGFNIVPSSGVTIDGLLIEDCDISYYGDNIAITNLTTLSGTLQGTVTGVEVRRSVITDSYRLEPSHSQGIYAAGVNGLTLEENVFDHNGWNASVSGAEQTVFNHDAYVQSTSSNLVARGNIFANASSHGLQARPGGVVEDNVFLDNPLNLSFGYVNGAPAKVGGVSGSVANNVILGGNTIDGAIRGSGMEFGNIKAGQGTTVSGNIIAHYTGGTMAGMDLTYGDPDNPSDAVGINDLTIEDNIIYDWYRGFERQSGMTPGSSDYKTIKNFYWQNNQVQEMSSGKVLTVGSNFNTSHEHYSGNEYDTVSGAAKVDVIGQSLQNWSSWSSGRETGSVEAEVDHYFHPERTAGSYAGDVGLPSATTAAFLTAARGQSKANWNNDYTAQGLGDYIRDGFNVVTLLPAPTNVVATPVSTTQVDLSWTENATDESYVFAEYSTAPDFTTGGGGILLSANSTSHSFTDLIQSTTYYFRVRSVPDGLGDSEWSETVSVMTPGIPRSPSDFHGTAPSTTQIDFSWTDNAENETGYRIERASDSAFTQNLTTFNFTDGAGASTGTRTFNDTTVQPGMMYWYRPVPYNSYGEETNVGGLGLSTPTISNGIGADFNGGLGVYGTDQYHGHSGNGWGTGWILSGNQAVLDGDSVITTSPVNGGGAYLFGSTRATGTNAVATVNRQYTSARGVDTGAAHKIEFDIRPENTSAAGFNSTNDRIVAFGNPTSDVGTSASNTWAVAAYGAANGTLPAKTWAFQQGNPTDGSFTLVNTSVPMVQGHVYHVTINLNPAGKNYTATITDLSNSATFTSGTLNWRTTTAMTTASGAYLNFGTRADTVGEFVQFSLDSVHVTPAGLAAPSGVSAAPFSGSPSKITVSWSDVSGETGYKLERKLGNGAWTQIATPAANATSYTDIELPPSTAFQYRLRATDGTNDGPYSSTVSATTNAASTTTLSAPANFLATAGGSTNSIGLVWNNISGEVGYLIQRKTGPSGTWESIAIVDNNVLSYTDTGLASGTNYVYRVKGYSATSDGAWSNEDGSTTA